MANGFAQYGTGFDVDPMDRGEANFQFPISTPEAMEGFRGFAGDAAAFRSPSEDWARLQTRMSPFWQERAPMNDLISRMMGRYYLGAPYISTAERPNPTFADYLTRFTTPAAGATAPPAMASLEELRDRAREAAQASTFEGGPDAYVAASRNPEEFRRRAVYASLFGQDAANQAANQLAVAQTLAMQRVDPQTGRAAGTYRGRMGDAIRNALQRVQQYRTAQGAPRESFLDWYLNKYHTPTTTA
jgi:hypothetical protein